MIFGFGKKKKAEEEEVREEIELISFKGPLKGDPPNLRENPGLVKAGLAPAKEIISDAISRRAGTLRLDPKGERYSGMMLVDGMPYPGPRLPKQQGLAVTQILKLLAGLNIQVRNKPQRGGIKADLEGVPYELIIEVAPTQGGERLTIHMDNVKTRASDPEEVGIPEFLREKIRDTTAEKTGVLFACGPSRSGVTSTAIAMLRCVDAYVYTIYRIFDTGSWEVPYVNEFDEADAGKDLETTLVRCQRKEGEVIFCPPVTKAEDAKVLFEHASKSSLLSEFAARDTANGLLQLLEWVGDPAVVGEQLRGLLSQKLIRKLCDSCKEAYPPNPKLVHKLGLSKETKALYRHSSPPQEPQKGDAYEPCRVCGGLGYLGRTAMFEYLEMTDGMKEVLKKKPTPDEVRTQMKKDGMLTLQQDGLRLVAEGETSLEELQRVFKS